MKIISLLFLLVTGVTIASCQNTGKGNSSTTAKTEVISTIAPTEFEKKLAENPGVQLIDVRTPDEYNSGHIKGAVNIDINGNDFDNRVATLDKTKPVMVYCRSGGRSSRAAKKMETMGFTGVYDLYGGMQAWSAKGKPVE